MNNGQRVIACLLMVIAVMMGMNLMLKVERRAEAQAEEPLGPTPVGIAVATDPINGRWLRLFRLWDDATVESRLLHFNNMNNCIIDPGLGCNWFDIETCHADLDNSDSVDFPDLLRVLERWGPCPE